MSDIQIGKSLKDMSELLKALSIQLEDEKEKHLELLRKLNTHLQNSQDEIQDTVKTDIDNFLSKIELIELVSTITQSKNHLDQQQKNITELSKQIESLNSKLNKNISLLDKVTFSLTEKIQVSCDEIQASIIQNVSIKVKEEIIQKFSTQFDEQNKVLVDAIKTANKNAMVDTVNCYNYLIDQVKNVKKNHVKALESFEKDVQRFKTTINKAIENIDNAFLEVESKNVKCMNELYDSCLSFQKNVLKKLNADTDKINAIFDQKIDDIAIKMQKSCNETIHKLQQVEQDIDHKSKELISKLEQRAKDNYIISEKIIEKQTALYDRLCIKLDFKYFSLNSISILFIVLIILIGFNIAGSIHYSNIQKEIDETIKLQEGLTQVNSQLFKEQKVLEVVHKDTLELVKQSQRELKKKFPGLKLITNCPLL